MIPRTSNSKKRRGQVLVEFALCLPLLVLMFGIIVDYGWTMYLRICLHQAVRDGALMAIYDPTASSVGYPTTTQIQNRVIQSFTPFTLSPNQVTVTRVSPIVVGGTTFAYTAYDIHASFVYSFIVLLVFYPEVQQTIDSELRGIVVKGLTP